MKNYKILALILVIMTNLLFFTTSCKPNPDSQSAPDNTDSAELIRGGDVELPTTTAASTTAAAATTQVEQTAQTDFAEISGVWISYIELSAILKGKSEEQFRQSYAEMLDNCVALGINTAYVHLRAFGDAFYPSELFPWSRFATDSRGNPPDFDPLEVMLEETRSRNIAFHGWINPMRLETVEHSEKVPTDSLLGGWYYTERRLSDPSRSTERTYEMDGIEFSQVDGRWYLNPACPSSRGLITAGVKEILKNYAVDGIHIDDYFYPTTDVSFDEWSFEAYAPGLNITDLADFRRHSTNQMVMDIYKTVKSTLLRHYPEPAIKRNSRPVFSISPQGRIDTSYNELYADVALWATNYGFADYIIPQFYYGFENETAPYEDCVRQWQELMTEAKSAMPLVFGLAMYKVGVQDAFAGAGREEWIIHDDIIARQIEVAKAQPNYGGVVYYSYTHLIAAHGLG